jgi:hypothetical protein
MRGKGGQKAWVTEITDIKGGAITDESILTKMADVAEINDGYAWKTATQISQLQPTAQLEGTSFAALPQASSSLNGIDVKSEELPF